MKSFIFPTNIVEAAKILQSVLKRININLNTPKHAMSPKEIARLTTLGMAQVIPFPIRQKPITHIRLENEDEKFQLFALCSDNKFHNAAILQFTVISKEKTHLEFEVIDPSLREPLTEIWEKLHFEIQRLFKIDAMDDQSHKQLEQILVCGDAPICPKRESKRIEYQERFREAVSIAGKQKKTIKTMGIKRVANIIAIHHQTLRKILEHGKKCPGDWSRKPNQS